MTLKSIFLKVLAMYIMGKNAFKHILLIYGSFKKYEWNAQVWDYSLTRRRRRRSIVILVCGTFGKIMILIGIYLRV